MYNANIQKQQSSNEWRKSAMRDLAKNENEMKTMKKTGFGEERQHKITVIPIQNLGKITTKTYIEECSIPRSITEKLPHFHVFVWKCFCFNHIFVVGFR